MTEEGGNLLIAGATSVATQRLIDIVAATPAWSVTGLCRHPPASSRARVHYVAADFLDAQSCRKAVAGRDITHIVYAARAPHAVYAAPPADGRITIENVDPNMAMLRNVVEACEGPALRHVHALSGGKWYGIHLGPYRTPARESDPGHMPPNFYFDQQRYLETRAVEKEWAWSTSRPGIICGANVTKGPNFLSTIGAYAAFCRHYALPFDFPGKPGTFTSLQEMTEADQLAEAIFWMCRSPTAANEPFNVVNGDLFRWEHIWPMLADHFGLKMGRVRHFSLLRWMADKGPVWDEIVSRHGLQPLPLTGVASWGFADFLLGWDYDSVSSMTKIRRAGFHRIVDTEEMILEQLTEFRRMKVLP